MCLSTDDFKSFTFATIGNNQKGEFELFFEPGSYHGIPKKSSKPFVMIAVAAHFEVRNL